MLRFVTNNFLITINPSPRVKSDADLIWLEGINAISHDVYFGTDPDDLKFITNQTNNIFSSCHGKMKRWICNFSLGDLPTALKSNCVWMNKFDLKVDPRPIICMHEYLTQ